MQATLTIDDKLFKEAANLVSVQNPDLLVEMALTEFIQNHKSSKKRDVRELVGPSTGVQIAPDYDYKKLRIGE